MRNVILPASVLALLVSCVDRSSAPASLAQGWAARDELGSGSGSVAVARNAAGEAMVAWVRGTQLIAKRRAPAGSWSGEEIVGTAQPFFGLVEATHQVDGRAALVFRQDTGWGSFHRAAAGQWTGPRFPFPPSGNPTPALGFQWSNPAGHLLIVRGARVPSLGTAVLHASLNDGETGGDWQTTMLAFSGAGSFPAVGGGLGPQGLAVAAWFQANGNRFDFLAQRGTIENGFAAAENIALVDDQPLLCAVAVDAAGRSLALAALGDQARTTFEAWRHEPAGNWHARTLLGEGSGYLTDLRMLSESDGNGLAIWNLVDGGTMKVHACVFDAEAERWGAPELVATSLVGSGATAYLDMHVAIGTRGDAFLIWIEQRAGATDVRVRKHTMATGWQTPALLDTVPASVVVTQPMIAVGADGRATAAWVRIVNLAPSVVSASMR